MFQAATITLQLKAVCLNVGARPVVIIFCPKVFPDAAISLVKGSVSKCWSYSSFYYVGVARTLQLNVRVLLWLLYKLFLA